MQPMPIYLDYMATTPMDSRVSKLMQEYLHIDGVFGNPASNTHIYGKLAQDAVFTARDKIASVIHATPLEIVFTSGATEANNLAIIGAAQFYQRKGRHLITVATEHKAVLDSMYHLIDCGFEVDFLTPNSDGLIDLNTLIKTIRNDTVLISVMHVNNEIGVIQDIAAIGQIAREHGVLMHVDAAQSAGKLPIDMRHVPVDLMSFSGHKIYGPKGIGALYVRHQPRVRLMPQSFGGGHEGGLRSGTLATHQIVGMAEALYLAEQEREEEQARILALRQQLWSSIRELPGIHLNGHEHQRIAGNLNFSFEHLDGESLLLAFRALAISTTSACSSSSQQPSYVLKALGLSDTLAKSSVRLSIGRFTTEDNINKACEIINTQVKRLHALWPI